MVFVCKNRGIKIEKKPKLQKRDETCFSRVQCLRGCFSIQLSNKNVSAYFLRKFILCSSSRKSTLFFTVEIFNGDPWGPFNSQFVLHVY